MHVNFKARRISSSLALVVVAVLSVTASGVAQAAVPQPPSKGLSSEVATAYQSAGGVQLRSQLASLFSDPALQAAAKAVLKSDGPTGRNDLTSFQADLLKALITETTAPSILSAKLTGKRLSWKEQLEALRLQHQLSDNPAIKTLARAGWQLGRSSQLPADIATVVTNNSASYSALTPPATANQGGSAALDTVVSDVAALRTGSAFTSYASQLTPILQDSHFPRLLEDQSPLNTAAFLPASSLIALLIPQDHDPAITDIVKSSLEILIGIAATGAAILLAPEELAGAALVGVGLAVFAGLGTTVVGIIDLGTALDCDHDGDPFDTADVPGQEC